MAIYADENAVANSNRAFHQVTIERSMPWADDVLELVDELAGDKLPAALIEPVLEPRRARHAERRAALAAQARARERVAELEPRVDELSEDEFAELEQAGRLAHGEYTQAAYALCEKVRTPRRANRGGRGGTAQRRRPGRGRARGPRARGRRRVAACSCAGVRGRAAPSVAPLRGAA